MPPDALVCVVDDDESVRTSLARLFRSVSVRAETFPSARVYLQREMHDGPCCLVLDVKIPGINGLELQQRLAGREEQIVFITGHGDVAMCALAMKAGAVDFLCKPFEDEDLLAAVGRALERSALARKMTALRRAALDRLGLLTPRELEVMKGVIAGQLNKQIAADLGSTEKTVKIHRGRVMGKTGVGSVADLVRLAQAAGIATAPQWPS
jgi:FixJ family two-component response regulator